MPRNIYSLTWPQDLRTQFPILDKIISNPNIFGLFDNTAQLLSLSKKDPLLSAPITEVLAFIRLAFPEETFGNTVSLVCERSYFSQTRPNYLPGNIGNAFYWRKLFSSSPYSVRDAITAQVQAVRKALKVTFFDPTDPYRRKYYDEVIAHVLPKTELQSPYTEVTYLTKEEKERYRTFILDQRLFTLNTSGNQLNFCALNTNDNQRYMVVLNLKGEMFTGIKTTYSMQHSSFESSQPVLFAGYLKTDATGKLLHIESNSGHYAPTFESLQTFVRYLKSRGCDLNGVSCEQVTRIRPGSTEDCLKREKHIDAMSILEKESPLLGFYRDILPPNSLKFRV